MYKIWIVKKDEIKNFDNINRLNKFISTACTLNSDLRVHRLNTYTFVMIDYSKVENNE